MLYVNFLEPHSPFSGPLNDLHGEEDVRLPAGYPGTPVENEPELYRARRAGRNKKGKKEREVEDEPVTSREALIRKCRNYAGLCSQVDQAVGRILQALETLGQTERTIVVFTSDHGEMMGSHGLSGKNVLYEDAVRIPLLIRVPFRQQKPIRVSRPVSHIDLAPTLLALMGHPAPPFLQGESLMPLVEGGKRRGQDVFIEWHTVPDGPHARTIVSPDGWKLVLFDRDHCLLFDHNKDPLEMRNLYPRSDSAQTIRRLQSRLEAWQRRTGDRLVLSSC
jgi:arylsulfatase A-like enzyme